MKIHLRKGYDALQLRSAGGTQKMSPYIFYPVMLVSSLVILVSLGLYVRSLHKEHEPPLRALHHSTRRARLYSSLAYSYEAMSLLPTIPMQSGPIAPIIQLNSPNSSEKKIVCYYNVPSGKNASQELQPSTIHADLCTHINIAFATIFNKTIAIDERIIETVTDVLKLKNYNKDLKVLLSIGGSGQDSGFSEMVKDHASRKIFIRSIKSFIGTYRVDGVDLDWEFPAIHGLRKSARERQHFSQLLREIRSEYIRERRDYLLTIATAAPQIIVDAAYDIDEINKYVDYVNIMTYDFHYYTTYTPFTGFNAPLYQRPQEKYYLSTLNINYTTNMYIAKGLERQKIIIGVPTYGHTFTLANANNPAVSSPALGFGRVGALGFANYPQICDFFQNGSLAGKAVVMYDDYAKVPYMHKDDEWISFDDRQSVMEKAKFIKENNLGGAMIYSLNADDFLGTCLLKGQQIEFPLSQSLRNALLDRDL